MTVGPRWGSLQFPPMDRPSTSEVVPQLERYFEDHPSGAAAVWLFGSVARGTARENSDVDVGVLFVEDPPPALDAGPLDLEGQLERVLRRPTQLVNMNRAPVDLVHRILRDGILVCERDRSRRIRFEVRSRNEYFDLLPHLLRYRRHG